ncbi:unnamed protein product [Leptidea sinapis]|uniref:Uncharacterized protein n=1 Tax=Leptidea sinapis TaxID=189913 RepID=A0A5E4Q406_9NEOP|nr:unnamed protein product [Leptidea sinapis]
MPGYLPRSEKKLSKVPVAGCRCTKGSLMRNAQYRVVRGEQVVFEEEVTTIKNDTECGLRFEPGLEVQPGDTVLCYREVDVHEGTRWDPGF